MSVRAAFALSLLAVACSNARPPETGRWQPMASGVGLDFSPPAVWTGTELVVWGRIPGICDATCINSVGARYNPAANSWTGMSAPIPASLSDARSSTPGIWTGKEMLVWSGHCDNHVCPGGGAYDPAADKWRALNEVGEPTARTSYGAVWAGARMLVWGGEIIDRKDPLGSWLDVNDGGIYDPAADAWQAMATDGAPSPRQEPHVAWTGTRMLVWGGNFEAAPHYDVVPLADGASYDPVTNAWQPMRRGGPAGGGVSVWTGSEFIIWQGQAGAAYDPASDSWRPLASENAPDPPAIGPAVWTGTEMLVWGGAPAYGPGGRYNPKTNTWGAMTTAGQPSPRTGPLAAWTGSEMLVWGGMVAGPKGGVPVTDGARFVP